MKFEAGGTMYELKYTVNAVADLEELTKRPLTDIFKAGEFSAMRALFWAGLIESVPRLTLKGAGNILTAYLEEGHSLNEVFELVNQATEQAGFLQAQTGKKR